MKKKFRKIVETNLAKCMKFVRLVFFIDLVNGVVWLAFLVTGGQPGTD